MLRDSHASEKAADLGFDFGVFERTRAGGIAVCVED